MLGFDLVNLGFDLVDVGRDEVTIKAGKQANKRTLTFALQALAAIFGECKQILFFWT